jgi:hypothetical protein
MTRIVSEINILQTNMAIETIADLKQNWRNGIA